MDEMSKKDRNYKSSSDSDNTAQWPQTEVLWPLRTPNGDLPARGHTDRDPQGRFLNGNQAAYQHGARSRAVLRGLTQGAEASVALIAHRREIEADLGDAVSRIKSDLVARYVECCAMANFLGHDVAARGALTARGRSRAALNAYLSLLDRQHRLGTSIGLERHEKPVSLLAELIDGDGS